MTEAISATELKHTVSRIEALEEQKAAIAADIRDVYAEAKGNGFDPKAMRQVVKLRRMDRHTREELENLVDTYKAAIGL